MKRWYSDPFAAGAVGITCVAFAVSYAHTRQTIVDNGGYGWGATATALMPEAIVLLSVMWIRRGGDDVRVKWAWLGLVLAAAFTIWGNLAQARPTLGGYVVSVVPALAAIIAAGFVEIRKAAPAESVPESVKPPQPSRPVSPATSPATVPAPQSVGSVPAGGALTSSASGAGGGGLRAVPSQSDGGARDAAKAAALAYRDEHGVWPAQSWLEREGHKLSTAKRALKELKGVAA